MEKEKDCVTQEIIVVTQKCCEDLSGVLKRPEDGRRVRDIGQEKDCRIKGKQTQINSIIKRWIYKIVVRKNILFRAPSGGGLIDEGPSFPVQPLLDLLQPQGTEGRPAAESDVTHQGRFSKRFCRVGVDWFHQWFWITCNSEKNSCWKTKCLVCLSRFKASLRSDYNTKSDTSTDQEDVRGARARLEVGPRYVFPFSEQHSKAQHTIVKAHREHNMFAFQASSKVLTPSKFCHTTGSKSALITQIVAQDFHYHLLSTIHSHVAWVSSLLHIESYFLRVVVITSLNSSTESIFILSTSVSQNTCIRR